MSTRRMEQVAVGDEKVSITVTRKTKNDLLVFQYSGERWFSTPEAAREAARGVLSIFVEAEDELVDNHGKNV